MKKAIKTVAIVAIASSAFLMSVGNANAGYWINGNYFPTCVPGYWAPSYFGPIWIPGICG